MRGCYVCADEFPTENTMSKLTIDSLKYLADQLQQDANAVYSIIRRSEDGEINPDQAEAELTECGIKFSTTNKP
jgi:hypothetical protein